MNKIILIYANCCNPTAKGDFSLAGNIAKDLVAEIAKNKINISIILTSTIDGIPQFKSLYGEPDANGMILIEGKTVGLCALELFDSVNNEVIAFIEANRCKYAPGEIVERVLSPNSKCLFIGAANQLAMLNQAYRKKYFEIVNEAQDYCYQLVDINNILVASCGLGDYRLGLPVITKVSQLEPLSYAQKIKIPTCNYGFMYLNAIDEKINHQIICQYAFLTQHVNYVLVGQFADQLKEINLKITSQTGIQPIIHFHKSLNVGLMRNMLAGAKGELIVSTGVMSTLEAIQDKLPFYQDFEENKEFVASYLIAVKSFCTSEDGLAGMSSLIIELPELLFKNKPLKGGDLIRTKELLDIPQVSIHLKEANQKILEKANGKLAPRLLGFIGSAEPTLMQRRMQLYKVCLALQKENEQLIPDLDKAFRRAIAWDRLFELRILLKSMKSAEINKQNLTTGYTALHLAVVKGNIDCARELVKAGAVLDTQTKEGKTALHLAVANGNRNMIIVLISAGASIEINDMYGNKPCDTKNLSLQLFIDEYLSSSQKNNFSYI